MDKREAIMEAALALFAERGFHGTSVALIAEKANVGAGTIYRYFRDKEALVNALYQEHKLDLSEAVLSGLQRDLPPRRLFHEIWRRLAEFATKYPKVMMFLELHHHSAYLDQESRNVENRLKAEFQDFFEMCRQRQVTKDVPPQILMVFVTGAFFGFEKSVMAGEIERTAENEALAEELCWEAIRR